MSKEIDAVKSIFTSKGVVSKILLTFLIVFLCLFAWNVFQSQVVTQELVSQNKNVEHLIDTQTENGHLRNCVNTQFNKALDTFDNKFSQKLGQIFAENKIVFPADLNEAFMIFKTDFMGIKECLIDSSINK